MMKRSTEQFLVDLKASGVQVWLEGDKLHAGAADGAADPELIEKLRARKPELVTFLKNARGDSNVATSPDPLQWVGSVLLAFG